VTAKPLRSRHHLSDQRQPALCASRLHDSVASPLIFGRATAPGPAGAHRQSRTRASRACQSRCRWPCRRPAWPPPGRTQACWRRQRWTTRTRAWPACRQSRRTRASRAAGRRGRAKGRLRARSGAVTQRVESGKHWLHVGCGADSKIRKSLLWLSAGSRCCAAARTARGAARTARDAARAAPRLRATPGADARILTWWQPMHVPCRRPRAESRQALMTRALFAPRAYGRL